MKNVSMIAAALILAGGVALGAPAQLAAHSGHGQHGAAKVDFAAGEPGDPAKPFRTVEVVMTDEGGKMAFTPDRLEVKKGEQVRFVLRNTGLVDHEFLIDSVANNAHHKAEMEKHPDMQHAEPNGVRLKPNETKEILWRFSKSGTFEFACLLPGHYESGMKGTVAIK